MEQDSKLLNDLNNKFNKLLDLQKKMYELQIKQYGIEYKTRQDISLNHAEMMKKNSETVKK